MKEIRQFETSSPVLYCEYGLGGIEYWTFGDPTEAKGSHMRIDESFRTCIGYIWTSKLSYPIGTCFFVSVPLVEDFDSDDGRDRTQAYLVTAKHVIFDRTTNSPLPNLSVAINRTDGTRVKISLKGKWHFPVDDADVAVRPFTELDPDVYAWSTIPYQRDSRWGRNAVAHDAIVDQWKIGVGDDIRIIGLHIDLTETTQNVPIVRGGIISAMPLEPVVAKIKGKVIKFRAFLVEVRSIGGLSGCPVFVLADGQSITLGKKGVLIHSGQGYKHPLLLGMLRGHMDITKHVYKNDLDFAKTGITFVTPAQDIVNVLNNKELMTQRQEKERERLESKLSDFVEDSSADDFTQLTFEDSLKRASSRVSESDQETKETSE